MRTFKVRVYRDGGWFRKYVEDFEVKADEFTAYRDEVEFYVFNNGNKLGCDGTTIVSSFKSDKFTVLEV